jgi:hypothetical protein
MAASGAARESGNFTVATAATVTAAQPLDYLNKILWLAFCNKIPSPADLPSILAAACVRRPETLSRTSRMQMRGTTTILAGAIAAAVTFFQPAPAKAAAIGIQLVIDQTTGTLTSSLAGVGITNNGTNSWLINLGTVLTPLAGAGGTNMTWVDNDAGVNWLRSISGALFRLDTDWTAPTTAFSNCGGVPSPLTQGVSCLVGLSGGDSYFASVVERDSVPVPVPEPMALALFGIAVAGLGAARRRATD